MQAMKEGEREKYMSFWEHLEEFRWVAIKCLGVLLILAVTATVFVDRLFEIFTAPLADLMARDKVVLNQAGPFDGVFIKMKIGLLCGAVASFPVILLMLWSFISPALRPAERKSMWWIFASMTILFMLGVGLGYYSLFFVLPLLISLGVENADNIWRLNDYVTFLFYWELGAGAILELPLAMLVAVRLDLLCVGTLKKWRPYAFLTMFILSAVITSDPISLLVLGFALYVLYEIGIFLGSLQKKGNNDIV